MVACNVLIPQLFWLRRVRTCLPLVFVISILVNVGMWFERFIIIVDIAGARFLAVELGRLCSHVHRACDLGWKLRLVLHVLLAVLSLSTCRGNC